MTIRHKIYDRLEAIGDYIEGIAETKMIFFVIGVTVAIGTLGVFFNVILK